MDEPRTNDDLVRMLGLTSKQATNVITRLRAAGKVVSCGWKGRKQLYALNDGKTHEAAPRSPSPSPTITASKNPSAADIAFAERLRAQERESRALLRQYVEQLDDVTLSALIAATDAAIDARESWEKTHAD
ncbi:hypothetical protein Thpro_020529 [Acidihalobacter prosperus]|uniref:Uncharacterized protein n=2 Tax=Acidihalobacter prosperus TaxID=160660 RepID=A0A1A6C8B9_9GAMM|nr:hypothetical protein Thpro_020529 [Acidihalobacter prosperus]